MSEPHVIVIKGLTREGRAFRPSDWAQRLATAVGTPGADRRVRFHPYVHLGLRDGVNCVIVDARLREEDPRLCDFLLNFARNNDLQVDDGGPTPGAAC
jgi:hypothetical protein